MNCAFVNANRQFSSSLCLGVSRNITSESEFDTHFLSLPSVFLLGGQNIHQAYSVLLPWVCVCRGNSVCFVLACDFFFFLFSVAGLPCSAVWDFAQLEAAALHRGRVQRTCQGHTFLSFVSTPRPSAPSSDSSHISQCVLHRSVFLGPLLQTAGCFSLFRKLLCWMCTFSELQQHLLKVRARYRIFKRLLWFVFFNLTCPVGSSCNFLFTSPGLEEESLEENPLACGHCEAFVTVDSRCQNKLPLCSAVWLLVSFWLCLTGYTLSVLFATMVRPEPVKEN